MGPEGPRAERGAEGVTKGVQVPRERAKQSRGSKNPERGRVRDQGGSESPERG